MSGNHTKGPWMPVVGERDTDAVIVLNDGRDWSESSSIGLRFRCLDARAKFAANVTLMAASPDLLESLELLMSEIGDTRDDDDPTFIKVRAAMSKARGAANDVF